MKKKYISWIIIVTLVLTVIICIYTVFPLDDQYNYPNPSWQPKRGSFLINPETILESLKNGEMDVFTPNLKQVDGELPEVVFEKPINWKPKEYLMIADTLNQLVWKDTLDDWELYEMYFDLSCQNNPSGFEGGSITYFKTITHDNGTKGYAVRDFSIAPKRGYVEWRGGAGYPRPIFGWKRINLDNIKINAEDALRIAEENGGKDTRLRFNNDCRIQLFLAPEEYTGWLVKYSVQFSSELKLKIDPFTGKIIK